MAIIYKITNKINGKVYVGFTTKSLQERWKRHCNRSKNKSNYIFHNAIRKHGPDNFYKEVLTESENADFLLKVMEPMYIQMFQSNNPVFGYNMTAGGEGTIGIEVKESTRKLLSEINTGENNPNYGLKRSEETKLKISVSVSGSKNPMFGKFGADHPLHVRNLSEETKKKLSASLKGRVAWNKGKSKKSKDF